MMAEGTGAVISPETTDTSDLRADINRLVGVNGRQDFELNLAELNYDGGIFDIFRDTSKIASTTNVSVATLKGGDNDGKVTLGATRPDGFEDGNVTEWTPSGEYVTFEAQTGVVKYGTYAAHFRTQSESASGVESPRAEAVRSITSQSPTDITVALRGPGSGIDNLIILRSGGTDVLSVDVNVFDGVIRVNGTSVGVTPSGSTWYEVELRNIDWTNNVVGEVYVNGTQQATNVAFTNNASSVDEQYWTAQDQGFSEEDFYLDVKQFNPTSGSFTSVQKDLANDGFTSAPSLVVVTQDADIPVDTDIQYVIRDDNGNTVTVDQTALDTEIDVSGLTSTVVNVTGNLSGTEANTPALREWMVHFKE